MNLTNYVLIFILLTSCQVVDEKESNSVMAAALSSSAVTKSPTLVIYETSDSCSTNNIALVLGESTDCTKLIDKDSVASSVKINGECQNITDTSLEKACLDLQSINGQSTIYEGSDSCSSHDIILSVGENTNCSDYRESSKKGSSIKINGVCEDIADDVVEKVCHEVQIKLGQSAIYGSSDNCSRNDVVAVLNEQTNCNKLEGKAASVSINGECRNITDTTLESACLDIQIKSGYSAIYTDTDTCKKRNLSAAVNRLSVCSELTGDAASTKVNGRCQNITDTSLEKACLNIQAMEAASVIYSDSDNCSKSDISLVLNELSDCTNLEGNASSVKINGVCKDINDTSLEKTCVETQLINGLSVIYSESDDCSRNDIATVLTESTRCKELEGKASSVNINGKCFNITDTSLEKACLSIKEDN